MLGQLIGVLVSIASASDCAPSGSSPTTVGSESCRVQKDALEKQLRPSSDSGESPKSATQAPKK
ncbi:hypothetical protein [Candidatus Paracaedibacter symbiosus]|uniref:hypothetical protein n=1 Tax=Candidatus Paracaedibacter symbiosus TaxID=244582 RepID=UPI0012EBBAAF|nr:hypothetical protein [Candidatus Paracaedibacter symbiosus]